MLSSCIWWSRGCLRPTLTCFLQNFAWNHGEIDTFLWISYTCRFVHWFRSYLYPRFGFQSLPHRNVVIGSTIVCCPRLKLSCHGDVAANSSALHWRYVFTLPIVSFSLFFYVSWLLDLTQLRILFFEYLNFCSPSRVWRECSSLSRSLHQRGTCTFSFWQR